jgi:hypothetical protein
VIRYVWRVAIIGRFYGLNDFWAGEVTPDAVDYVGVLMDFWGTFIILTIIFGLGKKNQRTGLWTPLLGVQQTTQEAGTAH